MKSKLSRIRSPWRRLTLSLVIAGLVALSNITSSSSRARARMHWLGNTQRPRRLERVFLFMVMFVAMMTFESRQYVIWSIVWGGGASLYVIMKTMLMLKPKPAKV